ncbi:MAG: gamma-glutamyl-gamma-aminobutyrate hydrolase family protein, partial [Chloroflexi bacterium]|nr:gamma-glutamyl-gamma-aminobutyrate hydrolase family protein [Chloroflexota bacterium]
MEETQSPEASHRVSTSDDLEISTYLEVAEARAASRPESPESSQSAAFAPIPQESVVILDFGSQYSRLIARRVRECHVYCEVMQADTSWERIQALNPKGIILSGGPSSVYDPQALRIPKQALASGLPILGICYGMQALVHQLGGKVLPAEKREYGRSELFVGEISSPIFSDLPFTFPVWMSHGDYIAELPPGFSA